MSRQNLLLCRLSLAANALLIGVVFAFVSHLADQPEPGVPRQVVWADPSSLPGWFASAANNVTLLSSLGAEKALALLDQVDSLREMKIGSPREAIWRVERFEPLYFRVPRRATLHNAPSWRLQVLGATRLQEEVPEFGSSGDVVWVVVRCARSSEFTGIGNLYLVNARTGSVVRIFDLSPRLDIMARPARF